MKIINEIKRKIITLIKNFGYEVKSNKKLVKDNDFDAIINFLLKDKKNHIYFDIGANTGQSIERFKAINSHSIIHAFEPTPNLYKELVNKYAKDNSIKLNNLGVADLKSTLDLYSYKYNTINSFIPVDKKSKFSKSRILESKSNEKDFENKISVDVIDLDGYCEKNNINEIDLIKIDTQGYEPNILKGMEKLLLKEKVSIIELEYIVGFGYQKKITIFDIEKYLNEKNYKLIAIQHAGNIISFSNFQTDLIYVKNEIFENIRELHEKNQSVPGVTNKTDLANPYSY